MKITDKFLCGSIEATCWREHKDQPPGEKNEVIEIGVVPFALSDLTIRKGVSILVKPVHSHVSKFCTNITTITQELVDTGISFREACKTVEKELHSRDIPWISWGYFDRKMLMMQCEEMKIQYPFGAGHMDLKNKFAIMMGLKNEVRLSTALKMLGMEFIGTRHRSGDEAYNIARVATEMFRRVRGK